MGITVLPLLVVDGPGLRAGAAGWGGGGLIAWRTVTHAAEAPCLFRTVMSTDRHGRVLLY